MIYFGAKITLKYVQVTLTQGRDQCTAKQTHISSKRASFLFPNTIHVPLDLKPLFIINCGFYRRNSLFSTKIVCNINNS